MKCYKNTELMQNKVSFLIILAGEAQIIQEIMVHFQIKVNQISRVYFLVMSRMVLLKTQFLFLKLLLNSCKTYKIT